MSVQDMGMQLPEQLTLQTLADAVGLDHKLRTMNVQQQCRGPNVTMGQ